MNVDELKGETEKVHRKKENCVYHYNLFRPLGMEKEREKKPQKVV